MLIIAGSPDVNIQKFIALTRESNCEFTVDIFHEWQQNNVIPKGFVYIKVLPEISFNRLKKTDPTITLDTIETALTFLNNYFIAKTAMPQQFHHIPVLVLNGFVDFEVDFSQFYNHLFYMKRFFKEIKEKEEKAKGTYVAPKKHTGCKC